jgi:hypothetical protein
MKHWMNFHRWWQVQTVCYLIDLLTHTKRSKTTIIKFVTRSASLQIATQKPNFISNWNVRILLSRFVCISLLPFLSFYKPCLHVFVDFQKSGDQILRSRILCQT